VTVIPNVTYLLIVRVGVLGNVSVIKIVFQQVLVANDNLRRHSNTVVAKHLKSTKESDEGWEVVYLFD